jgi:alkylation response protein AidB-like acyl-CoA dehydrogenase
MPAVPDIEDFRSFFLTYLESVEPVIATTDAVPSEARARLAHLGALRLVVPAEHAGFDLSMVDYLPYLEIAAMGPAVGRMLVHIANGVWRPIAAFGTSSQQELIRRIGEGSSVVALAITEPRGTGRNLMTQAVKRNNGWSITGRKHLVTFADSADVFIVLAITDDSEPTMFMLDRRLEGLTIVPQPRMGLSGIGLGEVRLDAVQVDDACVLGGRGDGFKVVDSFLNASRVSLAGCMVGLAQRALDIASDFARQRVTFGKAIGERQAVQVRLANMHAAVSAGRALVRDSALRADSGSDFSVEAATAKLFCSEMVCSVTESALRIFGGVGYLAESVVQRLHRDARAFLFEEGTSEVQQLLIARALLA